MEKQKCGRCKAEEYIPTHQFVKFDDKLHYVCQTCWDNFRKWFFYGTRSESPYVDHAA